VVHGLPSSQGAWFGTRAHPFDLSHVSSVHGFPSLQSRAGPPTHSPFEHRSPLVHAFPSLQVMVMFACSQPDTGLHESAVQGFPSSQFGGGPPVQLPLRQASAVVQAL
jgi:hypothetical protein